jgi:hypothetical protein
VELEDGRIMVIVQEQDRGDDFARGDNVRVIQSADGTLRVRQ